MNEKYSAEFLARAQKYWEDPTARLSAVQASLGVTKNVLVGLAHRNDWRMRRVIAPAPPPAPIFVDKGCVWPVGHPGDPAFHFCNDPAHPARPYCRPHCERAYVGFNPNLAAAE